MELEKQILIVEDELINRELLRIFLEHKYSLVFAADLKTARVQVDSIKFDLIITDIRLSNRLDGIQLLQYVRNGDTNKNTPVVAYTSSNTSINQKSFAEEGFDGFISKPIQQEEMLLRIETLISSK